MTHPAPPIASHDQQYWLDRRAEIIAVLAAVGYEILSDKDRVWLHRVAPAPDAAGVPPGEWGGLSPKQAWWAGYRVGKGLPADMPRSESIRAALSHTQRVAPSDEITELRAQIARLTIRNEAYENAYRIAYQATFQSHTGHWDATGQHGAGCPECIRAREARENCDKALRDGLEKLAKTTPQEAHAPSDCRTCGCRRKWAGGQACDTGECEYANK